MNLGALAAFGSTFLLMPTTVAPAAETPAVVSPGAPFPQGLLDAHGCWSGEAPADMAGVVPGHVVITRPGADEPTYAGARAVGQALEQIFEGVDHDLTVHGFCR